MVSMKGSIINSLRGWSEVLNKKFLNDDRCFVTHPAPLKAPWERGVAKNRSGKNRSVPVSENHA